MKAKKNSSKKKSHPFWQWFWLTFLVVSLWYAWYSFYVPTPTTIFIDPKGKVIDYAVGKVRKTKFLEMLKIKKGFQINKKQ